MIVNVIMELSIRDSIYKKVDKCLEIPKMLKTGIFEENHPLITLQTNFDFLGLPLGKYFLGKLVKYGICHPIKSNLGASKKPTGTWMIPNDQFAISNENFEKKVDEIIEDYSKSIFNGKINENEISYKILKKNEPKIIINDLPLEESNIYLIPSKSNTQGFLIINVSF